MLILPTQKRGFTLLELIFVIIILGVISSIGSSAIVQIYESYLLQRSVHNASINTELAINKLANRLTYRMNESLLAREPGKTGIVEGIDFYPARSVPLDQRNTYIALEWIGYDSDSFEAYDAPRWSGYTDLASAQTNFGTIHSVGSDNTEMNTIIKHYTGTADGTGGALRFMTSNYDNNASKTYTSACLYGGTSSTGCLFPVNIDPANETLLNFPASNAGDRTAGAMIYSEFYQYATSAFAVVPENETTINGLKVYDLNLYYAYQPWQNENYEDGKSATLLKNVSVFRFRKEENSIRIKLCVIERTSDTDEISICKEKAVIR